MKEIIDVEKDCMTNDAVENNDYIHVKIELDIYNGFTEKSVIIRRRLKVPLNSDLKDVEGYIVAGIEAYEDDIADKVC